MPVISIMMQSVSKRMEYHYPKKNSKNNQG